MPCRTQEEQKLAQHKSYLKNKDKIRQRLIDRRNQNRNYVNNIKANSQCVYCGEGHIACLDFHHKDSSLKEEVISRAVVDWTLERLKTELDKCEIVCSNCHRKIHYLK